MDIRFSHRLGVIYEPFPDEHMILPARSLRLSSISSGPNISGVVTVSSQLVNVPPSGVPGISAQYTPHGLEYYLPDRLLLILA